MTPPRQIHPNTLCFVTVRAVNRCFRFVPTPRAIEIIRYCLAFTLSKYRNRIGLHEFLWMSNHFHLVLTDKTGCLPRFMEELDSLLARAINALHGTFGTAIEKGYNLVEVETDSKLVDHCVYTLANPCSAHLVERSRDWKGVSSRSLKYGAPIAVQRPEGSLWSSTPRHLEQEGSQSSNRAKYRGRSKLPEVVQLVLERPAIMPAFSDGKLRRLILKQLDAREVALAKERKSRGLRVVGWDKARNVNPRWAPEQLEKGFGTVPSFSGGNAEARIEAWKRRRAFLEAYYVALRRFLGGEWDTEFPEGTWLMNVRFGVKCCPLPAR